MTRQDLENYANELARKMFDISGELTVGEWFDSLTDEQKEGLKEKIEDLKDELAKVLPLI